MKSELKDYLEQNLRIKRLMVKEYEENMRELHLNELGLINQEINFLELCLMFLKKEIKEKDKEIEYLKEEIESHKLGYQLLKINYDDLKSKELFKEDFEAKCGCYNENYIYCKDCFKHRKEK